MSGAAPQLKPLLCGQCGAAVPLAAEPQRPCPFCGQLVVTPPQYLQAVAVRRDAVAARRAAEPKWRRLAAGSSPWWQWIGGALMVFAPPILTAYGLSLEPPQAMAAVFAMCTLPALYPGAIAFVWGATADVTKGSYQGALAATPPAKKGEPPGCRGCGAPLAVGADDVSATCLYCGTDSLVVDVNLDTISTDLRKAMGTLQQATRALSLRLWIVRLALLGIAATLVGLSLALWWAQQQFY